ncbi:amino acid adenylation domain-containing protein [Dolichospermum sp. ST_sed1]|nr:amino acid adenylation domain-containing protein [Dolichospermum sp. ST_sed1]MDD1422973.1 amino acid adenylation domain-containing protein [Dolichospermum sp. ST_sed9]MDD1433067.1 amino acid adenylation domain-containing protein [Dolichospermum sp. ST_sed6]MDD1442491.1 amino acid adenylation domain-containing protein [Dolichospermum sp. ST_sed3]MDD1453859.1 amino acid adenylation domain-containing protein [Dolichospermum sp. ST_sed7]MDD1461169.1 amino acid adenylation domain-containing prot
MEEMVINSNSSLENLPVLTEQEKYQILVEWNNTTVDYPQHLCIHELFAAQVEKTPDNIAVVFDGQKLTYQELNHQANKVAHYLQSLGVGTEVLVGISVERSLEMIVGLLGILKAGAAYLPLDPTYPKERLSFMLSDSQVQVLLTQQKFVESFADSGAKTVCLDQDWELITRQNQENPTSDVTAENLAYVIYTSGSTGTPKGVMIQHRGVCNLAQAQVKLFGVNQNSRVLQFASFSFDASVWEIVMALCSGASLYLGNQDSLRPGIDLIRFLRQQSITHATLPPTALAALPKEELPNLQTLIVAGEACNPKLIAQWSKERRFFNAYGPTESTVCATVAECTFGETQPTIGRAIANIQIYILDHNLQPVPIGVPGELYIGGDGLARGYLNRPELTKEKFISNPFKKTEGSRLYKTGDLARYLPDGNIEFLGRVDNQVKIRGFRIELDEIEKLLIQHPDVKQAAVIAREDIPGDKRLLAYVVLNQKPEAIVTTLKNLLQENLPQYMIPGVFVVLDSLPLTPNGKVDRQNLPVCDRTRPDLEESFVAPRNPIEERLAAIWADLLGFEQIGVNDNFFNLGGHSLIVAQILSRVRDSFQVELSFANIFANPTVAGLASVIQQHELLEQKLQSPAIQRISRAGMLPVSFAQERVYFIQEVAPENTAYQAQATLRFQGHLDVIVLKKCLSEIVQRHEIFRTTFPAVNGRLFQVIHSSLPIELNVVDIQKFTGSEQEAEIQRLFDAEVKKPFYLDKLPLVRWLLLKLNDQDHLLVHIEHHMVHDGWSFNNVFLKEFLALYQAFCEGHPSPLPELPIQFVDFASWQREWVQSQEAQAQLAYWQKKLSGSSPLLELPLDRPRSTEQTYNGTQIRVELPIQLSESLHAVSRQEGVTLFMTTLAAFLVMLSRYTRQDDLCVGTAVANRRKSEVEGLIGMIVNNLVLRTDVSGNPTFRELLSRVRETTLEAFANEDLPFDKVVEVLKPVRNLSYNPLFQAMFSFHDTPLPDLILPGLKITTNVALSNKSTKFDLDVVIIPNSQQQGRDKGITVIWEHNTDLFDAATIQQMVDQYQNLLETIVVQPNQQIRELPLLTPSQQRLLGEWNQTDKEDTQNQCIHKLFELQVELTPDAIALEQNGQKLTYRELSDRANKIAHYLQSLGVKPETLVGICVDRSLEMIAGLLGILKAGGAYVPIDPAYPQERITEMISDTQLSILLTQNRFQEKLTGYTSKTICLDTDWAEIASQSTANPVSDVQLNNLAYIIYTSGSTGKPKGVMIEHRSLLNFVTTAINEYGINAQDQVLQFASVCFDTSIEEIFPCLAVGATLVLRTEEMLNSSDDFWRCCQKWQLTVLDLPTAYWHQLVTELNPQHSHIPGSLRTVIIGGEEVHLEKVQHWHHCVAHLSQPPQLFNSYGPTEATVVTTLEHLTPTNTAVSIGKPISNAQVYVLDQNQQPVPIGVPGELHIGGAGLARGYWQRPELTNEKFIENPMTDNSCGVGILPASEIQGTGKMPIPQNQQNHPPNIQRPKLYKTGDLVRFRRDGNLEYLGRVDNQVKIRGFRIELGEIETVLRQHPQISQAVVIAHQEITGQKRLVAYFVPQNPSPNLSPTRREASEIPPSLAGKGARGLGFSNNVDEIRQFLKQKLPNYMIPAAFMVLDTIPMTPNQKVDYRALPTPDFSRSAEDKFAAPRTLIEEKLVAIWSEVLRIENVGIHDNFFELGGDSILSIQLISKANQSGIQIAAKQLFKYQTIAELATVAGMTRQINAEQGLVTGKVGLTPIQKWFFEQKLPEINYFNQSALLEVPADLQPELLQEVVQKLLVHHDALLSQFVQEGENWQQIHTDVQATVPLSIFDLSHLSPAAQETTIKAQDTQLQASLDLATGEIAKFALFQLGKDKPNCLLFIIHHLAVDGVSWRILLEDLATAYQQVARGQAIKLPEKTTSWQYWSDRLTEYAQTEAIKELDYWLNQSNISTKTLPVDYPAVAENNTLASTASVSLALNEEQTRALLQDVPAAYNTQINDVLLTALGQSFTQWTGENYLLIDLEGHGREDLFEDVDLSRTVGWFTTLFPVGLEIKENQLGEALKSVKEQLRSIPNRGIGYGVLRYLNEDTSIREKLASFPSAQVSFNYLGQFDQVLKASSVLGEAKEFKSEQSLLNRRSHLLGISGFIRAGKLEMTWAYSDKIHKRDTIERLASGFMEALTTLIDHCQSKDEQSYTPSDFSAAKLNQKQLDKFLAKINKKK